MLKRYYCFLLCFIFFFIFHQVQLIELFLYHFFSFTVIYSALGFSIGHVQMWELDCEERKAPKSWCFGTGVLKKTLESPLDCKEIQPVHPKGNQPWVFIGRTDAKAETPILWPSHVRSWLIWKDPDAGRDWGQKEKGMTEDEMAGWHHWLDGHESEWTLGVGDWQGGLACYYSWGHKESKAQRLQHPHSCGLARLLCLQRTETHLNITTNRDVLEG